MQHSISRLSCKKLLICVVAFLTLVITFPLLGINLQTYEAAVARRFTMKKSNAYLSIPTILQERVRILSDGCVRLHSTISDKNSTGILHDLVQNDQSFERLTFVLRSQFLMSYAVPHAATKTLLRAMIYVHLKEILNYLVNNQTDFGFSKFPTNKLVNTSVLLKTFSKVSHSCHIVISRRMSIIFN